MQLPHEHYFGPWRITVPWWNLSENISTSDASSASFRLFTTCLLLIAVTEHLHSYYKVTLVQQCRLVKIGADAKQDDTESRAKLEHLLTETEESPSFSLTQGNPNIRSSHKQLSFSSSLTSGSFDVSSHWVAPDPRSCQADRTFSDMPLRGHSSFGLQFKCQGEEEWSGSDRECEGQGRGFGPRHPATLLSLFPSISNFLNTCLTPDAGQRQAIRLWPLLLTQCWNSKEVLIFEKNRARVCCSVLRRLLFDCKKRVQASVLAADPESLSVTMNFVHRRKGSNNRISFSHKGY